MEGMKKTVAFLFFLLAGVVLGTAAGSLCTGVPLLGWLARSVSVGLSTASPAVIDLMVLKFCLGFELNINAAQVIFVIAALIIYNKTCKGM